MTSPTDPPSFDPHNVAIAFSDADIPADAAPLSDAPPDEPPPPVPEDQRGTLTRIMGERDKQRKRGQARNGAQKPPKEPKPTPPKDRPGALVKPIQDMYASIGMAVFAIDQQCGRAVLENAEGCAVALDKAARENPAIRRVIHRMIETSVMGAVIAAHAPIAISIAQHHMPAFRDAPSFPANGFQPPAHTMNGATDG